MLRLKLGKFVKLIKTIKAYEDVNEFFVEMEFQTWKSVGNFGSRARLRSRGRY